MLTMYCFVICCYMCLVVGLFVIRFFFFKQKTAYEMRISDWSSDVCSSDLLEKMTDRTVTSIAVLEQQVAAVRAAGWASAYEEMMLGINGVAVPVFDETGDCVASLAIVGSIQ